MKTLFYERTAYQLSDEPVPSCFYMLDDYFETRFVSPQEAYTHLSVLVAESVCGRMADVEMYAFLMDDALRRFGGLAYAGGSTADIEPILNDKEEDDDRAAILIRSFFVGYLGACEALLDSGAIALTELYRLPLSRVEQRFDNSNFWHQLVVAAPNVHRRYHSQRLFFLEVMRWRDEAANRIPPIALLQGYLERRSMHLQVIDGPSDELQPLGTEPRALRWIDPMELHRQWKPRLLDLCERLCQDIKIQT
jgi:hypothetical protein